jgi:hypothetical protein
MLDIGHSGRVSWIDSIPLLAILALGDPLLVGFSTSSGMRAVFLFVFAVNFGLTFAPDAICRLISTGAMCVFHKPLFLATSGPKNHMPPLGEFRNRPKREYGVRKV